MKVGVLGLGAHGSATAYYLTKRGHEVVGFDKFSPPHDHGSTHGESRITRTATAEGPEYMPLASRSHELWRDLEVEWGKPLFFKDGILLLGEPGNARLQTARDVAVYGGISVQSLNASQIKRRYPAFVVDENVEGLFQADGGYLLPEEILRAHLQLSENLGATLFRSTTVEAIESTSGGVTICAAGQKHQVDTVVVSAGSWVQQFLPEQYRHVPVIERQNLHWYEVDPQAAANFLPGRFPPFIWYGEPGLYGFPSLDQGRSVKVAWEQSAPLSRPEDHQREVREEESLSFHEHHVKRLLDGLTPRRRHARACMYTNLPNKRFLIDFSPGSSRVILVSACSGHGFKHSAAVGEAIADLLSDAAGKVALEPFSWHRFTEKGAI